jgi:hypothetical protein
LRARFEREVERAHTNLFDRSDPPQGWVPPAEVQIHGLWCNGKDTRDAVKRCHKHNWHWQRALWQPRDIVVNRKTGKRSFELTLGDDSANFEVIKAGWKKDHCVICGWDLFESEDHHGVGYSNGFQWICLECHATFWDRPGFVSGGYGDIT